VHYFIIIIIKIINIPSSSVAGLVQKESNELFFLHQIANITSKMVKSNYNTILSFTTVATVNGNVRQKGSIKCITLMIRLILFIFTAAFDLY